MSKLHIPTVTPWDVFRVNRVKQSILNGRTQHTFTDEAAEKSVFDVAMAAMKAVAIGGQDKALRAVSLPTGYGKSTSAWAFIATMAQEDPEFSCAYVCPTARLCEQAQGGIEALLGPCSTTLWTNYHDTNRDENTEAEALANLGHVPTRLAEKSSLPERRIVIVSHGLLAEEIKHNKRTGIRYHNGNPRSVVFVDEHPELLAMVETKAFASLHGSGRF